MSKPTSNEIAEMGFSHEMFGLADNAAFTMMLKGMITEQGNLLSGRISAATFASTTEPTSSYVKRALKCVVAAELCQRRINRLGQETKLEDGSDAKKMRQNRVDYLTEADLMISKVEAAASNSNDFAVGAVITSHFAEDA